MDQAIDIHLKCIFFLISKSQLWRFSGEGFSLSDSLTYPAGRAAFFFPFISETFGLGFD